MSLKSMQSFKFEKPPKEVNKALQFLEGNFFAQDPMERHQATIVVVKEELRRLLMVAQANYIDLEALASSDLDFVLTLASTYIPGFSLRSKKRGNPRNVVIEHHSLLAEIDKETAKGVRLSHAFRKVCKRGMAGQGMNESQVSSIFYRAKKRNSDALPALKRSR